MAKTTLQVVLTQKDRKEIEALARHERRSLSFMAGWLISLGKAKYYEQDAARAKAVADSHNEGQAA